MSIYEGIHPLLLPLIDNYFDKQKPEQLQKLKEEINKKIENEINLDYWRKIRIKIGEHIRKQIEIENKSKKKIETPFEKICNRKIGFNQKIIKDFDLIESENKKLIPQIFCKKFLFIPRNKYTKSIDNSNEIPDGYEIAINFENFKGKINYKLEKHEESKLLYLIVYSESNYVDIKFEIENKKIETSQRKGYNCFFENNLFYLKFHYKRDKN